MIHWPYASVRANLVGNGRYGSVTPNPVGPFVSALLSYISVTPNSKGNFVISYANVKPFVQTNFVLYSLVPYGHRTECKTLPGSYFVSPYYATL